MSYPLTTLRGTPAWSSTAPKFGTYNLATGGLIGNANADLFLSSTGANGGNLTTGTIEAWLKGTGTTTQVWTGRDNWYWGGMVSGKAEFHYGPSASEVVLSSTATLNDGAWHHVALVFNAGAGSLYVDGNRVATSSTVKATGTPSMADFVLGGFGPTGFDWAGSIDEVRISNVARYTGATYTVPTAAFTPDTNTIALYHLENNGNDSAVIDIAPNDAAISYSPYNWLVGATVAESINSGAYFRTMVQGSPSSISLLFDLTDVSTPLPQVAWRVDNGGWSSAEIAAEVPLTIPSGNAWTVHHVEVVVKSTTETVNRWNSPRNASVKFLGFRLGPTSATLRAGQTRSLKALIFGDSITEGVRTLNSTATKDTDRNDAREGWAWRLGENLGAEVGCVGFGGTGISVAGSGNVPVIGTNYASLWSGQSRDITTNPPDVIIVNIGTNDGATNTVAAMTTLLNNLLAATPGTTEILVMRPFNGNQAANLQSAVSGCNDPGRVTYVDTSGWWSSADSSDSLHPYGYANVGILSRKLAAAVRDVLAQGSLYLNVGGSAQGVSIRV